MITGYDKLEYLVIIELIVNHYHTPLFTDFFSFSFPFPAPSTRNIVTFVEAELLLHIMQLKNWPELR